MAEKSKLKLDPHNLRAGDMTVEVWYKDELVAAVYGADGPGIRIVTKHPYDIVRGGSNETVNVVEVRIEK